MSREVRRVALDFEWELGKVWKGYIMPEDLQFNPCPARGTECFNGLTRAGAWVMTMATMINMLDEQPPAHRPQTLHPYFDSIPTPGEWVYPGNSWGEPGKVGNWMPATLPSDDIKAFVLGYAGREGSIFGHDAIDRWSTYDALVKGAGLDPTSWGRCLVCEAKAYVEAYPGQAEAHDLWKPTEPPKGEGWQLWETVSEGSPQSPVFKTDVQLAQWLSANPGKLGPSDGFVTVEKALKWVQSDGWMPTMVNGLSGADLIEKDF